MDFNNIHQDIHHKCATDSIGENVSDIFSRKIDSATLSKSDFLSAWELGKKPEYFSEKVICLFKGVSVNKITDQSQEVMIKEKYKTTKKIKPQSEAYYLKFKFNSNAGKIWETSSKADKSHCTFFKSDDFDIDRHINTVSIEPI